MATEHDFKKLAELIRQSPLEPEQKLQIIEVASRCGRKRIPDIVALTRGYITDVVQSEKDFQTKISAIQNSFNASIHQLESTLSSQLKKIDGNIGAAEDESKIDELRKKISPN
ncbi:MAG: hypothetical protein V1916_00580 [Patescibacteria group bacterium]